MSRSYGPNRGIWSGTRSIRAILLAGLAFVFGGCNPGVPARPGSVALVRQTGGGAVVLRQVWGETLYPVGYPVATDQEVALPAAVTVAPESAPSALLYRDRFYVAQALVGTTSTTISIVDSAYATTLYAASPRTVAVLPYPIDSAVKLTTVGGDLLIAFRYGNVLRGLRSSDGESWTPIIDLRTLPAASPFSLHSDGLLLWLAYGTSDGVAVEVSLDAVDFDPFPAAITGLGTMPREVSVATDDGHVYVAYCDEDRVWVTRATTGGGSFAVSSVVAEAPAAAPTYQMYSVTIQPSPYGWALQWVASLPTPTGLEFALFGRRSVDGLVYTDPT